MKPSATLDASPLEKEEAMRVIRRVFGLLVGGFILSSALSALAAVATRRRMDVVDAPNADEVHLAAVFEPIGFHSTAGAFRGGTVDCWYGGGYIDLRDAALAPAGATLRVRAIFGGGQVVVPEGWNVTSRVIGIGGVGDNRARPGSAEDRPHLHIEGLVVFGGFAVTSELPQQEVDGIAQAHAGWQGRTAGELHEQPAA